MTALRIGIALAAAIAVVAIAGPANVERAHASDDVAVAASAVDQQTDGDGGDDTRVAVQVWTVLAAGGAAAVVLVLFLLRVVLGRVKEPPPPEEHGGH